MTTKIISADTKIMTDRHFKCYKIEEAWNITHKKNQICGLQKALTLPVLLLEGTCICSKKPSRHAHTPLSHPMSLVMPKPVQLHPVLLQCLETHVRILQSSNCIIALIYAAGKIPAQIPMLR